LKTTKHDIKIVKLI